MRGSQAAIRPTRVPRARPEASASQVPTRRAHGGAVAYCAAMKAIAYTETGPAADVLKWVDLPTPEPAAGEVRVKLQWSGVNPSDVKSRMGLRTKALAFPQITPHSDGAGVIDAVGAGVAASRVGERVWIWNGQWQRPF